MSLYQGRIKGEWAKVALTHLALGLVNLLNYSRVDGDSWASCLPADLVICAPFYKQLIKLDYGNYTTL